MSPDPGKMRRCWWRARAGQSWRPTRSRSPIPRGRVVQVLGRLQANRQTAARGCGRSGHRLQLCIAPQRSRFPGASIQCRASCHRRRAVRESQRLKRTGVSANGWSRVEVCRLNDLETEAQLSAILYRATPSGKTEIESKEDAEKARSDFARSRRGAGHGVLQDRAARADRRFQRACRDFAVLNTMAPTIMCINVHMPRGLIRSRTASVTRHAVPPA